MHYFETAAIPWNIPSGQAQCKNLDPTFTCDFALYANATNLTEDQKLAPNTGLTGDLIYKSFIATTVSALILSFILCCDKVLYQRSRGKLWLADERRHYHHMIHAIDSWLLTLSDQQLASAIALLFTLNGQACTVSAYDYNVVCTMLLLSVVVHLVSVIVVSDYIYRGKAVAATRIIAIFVQVGLTFAVFLGRNTSMFPFDASSLAIMPAACFENTTIADTAGLADLMNFFSNITTNTTFTNTNTTGNGTETIWHNIDAQISPVHGLPEYITLVIFVVVALFTLCWEWHKARKWQHDRRRQRGQGRNVFHGGWAPIIICISSTVAGIVIAIVAGKRYADLTDQMEIEEWYQLDAKKSIGFSEILPLSLFGSSLIPVVQAAFGLLPHRVRRYFPHFKKQLVKEMREELKEAEDDSSDADESTNP